MGTQIKAFGLLGAVLILYDALAYHGAYRRTAVHGIASIFSSVEGPGQGRDWSRPRRQRHH